MIRFIDEHKDRRSGDLRWGIEPIANVVGIAPSMYHAARKRPPSARTVRVAELKPEILRVCGAEPRRLRRGQGVGPAEQRWREGCSVHRRAVDG